MKDYFKSEGKMFEFILLNLNGKERNRLLNVEKHFYTSTGKKQAQKWYNNIKDKLEDEKAVKELNELFEMITG